MQFRNGASATETSVCVGPREPWGQPCYPVPEQGCNADWSLCTTLQQRMQGVSDGLAEQQCQGVKTGKAVTKVTREECQDRCLADNAGCNFAAWKPSKKDQTRGTCLTYRTCRTRKSRKGQQFVIWRKVSAASSSAPSPAEPPTEKGEAVPEETALWPIFAAHSKCGGTSQTNSVAVDDEAACQQTADAAASYYSFLPAHGTRRPLCKVLTACSVQKTGCARTATDADAECGEFAWRIRKKPPAPSAEPLAKPKEQETLVALGPSEPAKQFCRGRRVARPGNYGDAVTTEACRRNCLDDGKCRFALWRPGEVGALGRCTGFVTCSPHKSRLGKLAVIWQREGVEWRKSLGALGVREKMSTLTDGFSWGSWGYRGSKDAEKKWTGFLDRGVSMLQLAARLLHRGEL